MVMEAVLMGLSWGATVVLGPTSCLTAHLVDDDLSMKPET
jgi:hypothetical protein